jgi:hypothetical protein
MRAYFPSNNIPFSVLYLIHEMPLLQKGTYAPPLDKQVGQTFMMKNAPFAPYD